MTEPSYSAQADGGLLQLRGNRFTLGLNIQLLHC
jgi:hypothetical protein